jgi:hexosaminidase
LRLSLAGAIWPKPKSQSSSANFNTLRPSEFTFESIGYSCDILQAALDRYRNIIVVHLRRVRNKIKSDHGNGGWRSMAEYNGRLESLKVNLKQTCEKMPHLEMDESCE